MGVVDDAAGAQCHELELNQCLSGFNRTLYRAELSWR